MKRTLAALLALTCAATAPGAQTTAQVLESAQPSDWRRPDPANILYMELPAGRVIIELAPRFAPEHVANI
ncbi:MAG TPA: hypothetical protein VFZ95_08480, partial [Steroidobacteraceae bacterium]